MDEDDRDSKIASTELRIIKQLTLEELFLHALAFMVDHPKRTWSDQVSKDRATARGGFAVVRGSDPIAQGKLGDILAFAKECKVVNFTKQQMSSHPTGVRHDNIHSLCDTASGFHMTAAHSADGRSRTMPFQFKAL